MKITDPITGVRVVWRGGRKLRAYDWRARLIATTDVIRNADERDEPSRRELRAFARRLRPRSGP